MLVSRIYARLLRLYPADYRQSFGAEMTTVFERAVLDCRSHGVLHFLLSEGAGLLIGAAGAWLAKAAGTRRCSIAGSVAPSEIAATEARINVLVKRTVHAIATHDFETARACSSEERREQEKLRCLQEKNRPAD
jgi:hypothetical protein